HTAARYGLEADLLWPSERSGARRVGVRKLVLDEVLPLAAEGLDRLGIVARDRDEYLGIIEARCRTGRNGATWQSETFHWLTGECGLGRAEALEELTLRYADLTRKGDPVHLWPVG